PDERRPGEAGRRRPGAGRAAHLLLRDRRHLLDVHVRQPGRLVAVRGGPGEHRPGRQPGQRAAHRGDDRGRRPGRHLPREHPLRRGRGGGGRAPRLVGDHGGTRRQHRRAGQRHRLPVGCAPGGPGGGGRRRGVPGGVVTLRPGRIPAWWLLGGVGAVLVAGVAGLALGPVRLPPLGVAAETLNLLPWVELESGLTPREAAIVTQIRLPRVVLGLLVGAMLALAGGVYQGAFRNPLAEPYLLGVAAGAGLGVTVTVALRGGTGIADLPLTVPLAAFTGAVGAVVLTYLLGVTGGRDRSQATLILAGVAVSAFLAALQTYLLQRHIEVIRDIYSWLLGRLGGATWHDVRLLLPYAVVTAVVVLLLRRELDVLSVGDDEAASLGLHPERSRYLLLATAS